MGKMKFTVLNPDIDHRTSWSPFDELAHQLEVYEVGKRVLVSDLPLVIAASSDEQIEQELTKRGVKVKIVEVQEARTPSWIKVEVMSA